MTTEQHITDLAARLHDANPNGLVSVSMELDWFSTGSLVWTYNAYNGSAKPKERHVNSRTFPELAAWVEANWLKKEQP